MAWIKTEFEGVWVFEPYVWHDPRGYFFESFNQKQLPESLRDIPFVQDNEAMSTRGVLRGLHYQLPPYAQAKLVRCTIGEVLDVIVDLRPGSATFGLHMSLILNDITKKQLFVPAGFAHGYVVLSEQAIFAYKCNHYYQPEAEAGVRFDDPALAIDWILPVGELLVSDKDKNQPLFANHVPFLP